ncbi:MAG: DUF6719 family protein [Burkholderiaceae bacterium]
MNRLTMRLLAASLLWMPLLARAAPEILREMPSEGEIPYRKIVYVDDKTCPAGQIKEVTGGSKEKSVPRKVRCVKTPR